MRSIRNQEYTISSLWNKMEYLLEIPYMIGRITEYDLSKANISALFFTNKIDAEMYNYIYNLPKQTREVYIGNMIRCNREDIWTNGIQAGIKEAKRLFFNLNMVQDKDILSIKNDAVFIIGTKSLDGVVNEYFTFKEKGVYDLFIKTKRLELYYGYNTITGQDILDIKGIRDDLLYRHIPFTNFLEVLFHKIINNNIQEALDYYNGFYEAYINRNLPIEYYREFNSNSLYKVSTKYASYYLDDIDDTYKTCIEIDYNISILRDIYFVLVDILFKRRV